MVVVNNEIAVIHSDVTPIIHQIELLVFKYVIVAGIQIVEDTRKIIQSMEITCLVSRNFDENSGKLDLNNIPYEKARYPMAANNIDAVNTCLNSPCILPHNISRCEGNMYKQIKYPPSTVDPPITFVIKKVVVADIYSFPDDLV